MGGYGQIWLGIDMAIAMGRFGWTSPGGHGDGVLTMGRCGHRVGLDVAMVMVGLGGNDLGVWP